MKSINVYRDRTGNPYALVFEHEGSGAIVRLEPDDVDAILLTLTDGGTGWVPGHFAWILASRRVRVLDGPWSWVTFSEADLLDVQAALRSL